MSSFLSLSADFNPAIDECTVAVQLGKTIFSLGDSMPAHATQPISLVPVSRDSPAGTRIYKRSVAFLLGAAVHRHFGAAGSTLTVMESVGASFHFKLSDVAFGDVLLVSLTQHIKALINEKINIDRREISKAEALEYFNSTGASHTLELINASPSSSVPVHTCAIGSSKFMALAHGILVPNTSFFNADHLRVEIAATPFQHFRLQHAVPCNDGPFSLTPTDEPKLLEAYVTRKQWGNKLGFSTVTSVNNSIAASKVKSVVQLSEALHDHQVVSIATKIAGSPGEPAVGPTPRLVLIAGPSSSGKTTFAKRLGVALETCGAEPIVISVDCYYRAWQEIDSRGMQYVDWESLKSLNLDLLNEHLIELLAGREVLVPEYDMKTSMPMDKEHWTPTVLPKGGIVIIEGIHGLNPELTPRVPKEDKFQIMISPISALTLDNLNIISSSQVRMLRRMVRDNLFRGRSAQGTLQQWPAVARGERNNIYPHQNNADVVMNSSLVYEAHVLKVYAEPLLRSIKSDSAEYNEAVRLLNMLDHLVSMPSTMVPPQSLLREFIGGSWFYDFSGYYKTA